MLNDLYHNLLNAFIDERYSEHLRVIKTGLHKPDTVEDLEYWQREISILYFWRFMSKLSPIVISSIAVIISIIALLV